MTATERQAMSTPEIWLYADPCASADAAIAVALHLASVQAAPLHIVGVLEGWTDPVVDSTLGRRLAALFREDQEERLRELHAQARKVLGADRVSRELLHGEVGWHSLVAHAVARSPAMVVTPAEGTASRAQVPGDGLLRTSSRTPGGEASSRRHRC